MMLSSHFSAGNGQPARFTGLYRWQQTYQAERCGIMICIKMREGRRIIP
jgi:hypothetical protein